MENKMILKVFDVDYSFIIKNYLNPELWEKEWTLFVYKKFVVTLKLIYIYVYRNKIEFEIKVTDNNSTSWNRSQTRTVTYSLKTNNITILKKAINSAIIKAFKDIEDNLYIEKTDEYYKLIDMKCEERAKLEEIAKEFLDENNITNENIRDSYIEAYVDNTENVWSLINDYECQNHLRMIPDLYLTFAIATDNKELEDDVLKANEDTREELLKKIEELEEYMQTEEYEEEVKDNLEEV